MLHFKCKPTTKMPTFDLEKDQESFKTWLSKENLHVQGNNLNKIKDKEERQTRILMELTSCLSDSTLEWLVSKNFDGGHTFDML